MDEVRKEKMKGSFIRGRDPVPLTAEQEAEVDSWDEFYTRIFKKAGLRQ